MALRKIFVCSGIVGYCPQDTVGNGGRDMLFTSFLDAFWPSDRRVKNIESTRQTPCSKSKPKRSAERGERRQASTWRLACRLLVLPNLPRRVVPLPHDPWEAHDVRCPGR